MLIDAMICVSDEVLLARAASDQTRSPTPIVVPDKAAPTLGTRAIFSR
jgi:hypothetical protein